MLDKSNGASKVLSVEKTRALQNTNYIASITNNLNQLNNYSNNLDNLREKFDIYLKKVASKTSKKMTEDTVKILGIQCQKKSLKTAVVFFAAGAVSGHLIGKVFRLVAIAGTASYLTLHYLSKYEFISINWDKVKKESDTTIQNTKKYIQDNLKDDSQDSFMAKISRFINNPDNAICILSAFGGILFGLIFL